MRGGIVYLWQIFWTVAVLVAGLAFAFVTVVVTMKGGKDLRELFARLLEQKKQTTNDQIEKPEAGSQ